MQSKATTVAAYLAQIPEDRRGAIVAVRGAILKSLNKGFAEGMSYGMIGYFIPHALYPAGYHCDPKQPLPFAALGAGKGYNSLHLMCLYMEAPRRKAFEAAWKRAGKKLDMGKACIRFKKAEDLALDVLAETIHGITVKGYIAAWEKALGSRLTKGKAKPPKRTAK